MENAYGRNKRQLFLWQNQAKKNSCRPKLSSLNLKATKDLHRMQDDQFNGQESEAAMATFSSTKQVKFHDPQNETIVLLAHASPVIGGSPSSERVSLRLLTDLLEEEAIDGEQGREKEEKEKEEEEEKLGFVLSEYVLWL
jgi:hypothetical protein